MVIEPFDQWALDFEGPINPPPNFKVYIMTCIDCVTKWVEAKALARATEQAVSDFPFEEIFVIYGIPHEMLHMVVLNLYLI